MPELTGDRFGLATITDRGAAQPAVVTERGVLPLAALLGPEAPASVRALISAGADRWCDRIAAALPGAAGAGWRDEAGVEFAAPLPDPPHLYMAGANYHDHIAEMDAAVPDKAVDAVFHFLLPTGSLVGTGHDIRRPPGATQLDWEVELAVVIGRRAHHVALEDALGFVAGYSVGNDVSVRGPDTFHPIFGLRFLHAKGHATMTPMGPVIVPARFVPQPGKLALSTHVNGELRQDSTTDRMVWSIEEQIAYLSGKAALLPGDVILTGTPAGTAAKYGTYLADGDVITARVEGLGVLTNRVVGA